MKPAQTFHIPTLEEELEILGLQKQWDDLKEYVVKGVSTLMKGKDYKPDCEIAINYLEFSLKSLSNLRTNCSGELKTLLDLDGMETNINGYLLIAYNSLYRPLIPDNIGERIKEIVRGELSYDNPYLLEVRSSLDKSSKPIDILFCNPEENLKQKFLNALEKTSQSN